MRKILNIVINDIKKTVTVSEEPYDYEEEHARIDEREEHRRNENLKKEKALAWLLREYQEGEHLDHLLRIVKDYDHAISGSHQFIIAVYHAAIDDGKMTYNDIANEHGDHLAKCVYALTRKGKTTRRFYQKLFSEREESFFGIKLRVYRYTPAVRIQIHKICDLLETAPTLELVNEARKYIIPHIQKRMQKAKKKAPDKNHMQRVYSEFNIEYLNRITEIVKNFPQQTEIDFYSEGDDCEGWI